MLVMQVSLPLPQHTLIATGVTSQLRLVSLSHLWQLLGLMSVDVVSDSNYLVPRSCA